MTGKHRSSRIANCVIALSMAYDRENLLTRGMGLEHLRELLIRLARPILRGGADLAYGGNWQEGEDNLTFELLRLIAAEQEDNSAGGPDSNLTIGRLYNHSAWPQYLEITPRLEAQWIGCCRIVRVDQALAGLAPADIVPDASAGDDTPRVAFNKAVTLSAMRRLMMKEMNIEITDAPSERVPPVVARILLGGRLTGYSGFLPGVFEEALLTMEHGRPTYLLGGFGGAAEVLAQAISSGGGARPQELTLDWQQKNNKKLAALLKDSAAFALPAGMASTEQSLDSLFAMVESARANPSAALNTGISDAETRELLATHNVATAVRLVRRGLANTTSLPLLPG